MNAPHIHLLLNHFPLIGCLFGTLILAGGYLLKNAIVKNVAFGVFIFTALLSIPVFFSGGQAEEVLEKQPGFSKAYVEDHEEAAAKAIWMVELLGIAAILSLVFSLKEKPYKNHLAIATLIFGLVAFAAMAKVNNAGGMISHHEIRSSTSNTDSDASGQESDD